MINGFLCPEILDPLIKGCVIDTIKNLSMNTCTNTVYELGPKSVVALTGAACALTVAYQNFRKIHDINKKQAELEAPFRQADHEQRANESYLSKVADILNPIFYVKPSN